MVTPEQVVTVLTPLGPVRARAMFGGHGIYCEDVMFALIANGVLYFRVDDACRDAFEAAGGQAFTYAHRQTRKPVEMPYYTVPEGALEDPSAFIEWGERALAAARRVRRDKSRRGER